MTNYPAMKRETTFSWRLFFAILVLLAIGTLAKVPAFIQVAGLADNMEVWGRVTAMVFVEQFLIFAAFPVPLALSLIWKTVVGNSLAALAFGWLYWKRGLVSAMLSHCLLDVCIYVLVPSLLPTLV